MSFTSQVKQELAALEPQKDCCMHSELGALSVCCASITLQGRGYKQVRFSSHSPSVLKRIYTLLKKRFGITSFPRFTHLKRFGGQRLYELRLGAEDSQTLMTDLYQQGGHMMRLKAVPSRMIRRICCRRAWIRGAFLGCGSLMNPERGYRAEFVLDSEEASGYLLRLLKESGVKAAIQLRRGQQVVYVREGDSLVTLLSLMGASRATLITENVRAAGDLKRDLNRAANCDHANMMKQLSAAQQQLEAITRISRAQGLPSLPPALEQLARLRIANPDAGLQQLAQMADPPLTKSGIQYRMRRLMDIASTVRER